MAITVFLGKHAVVKTSLLVIQIPSDHTRTQLGPSVIIGKVPSVIIGKVGVQKYTRKTKLSYVMIASCLVFCLELGCKLPDVSWASIGPLQFNS